MTLCAGSEETPGGVEEASAQGMRQAEGNVKGVGFPIIESLRKSLENNETWHVVIRRRGLRVTELGKRFCQICVISHDQKGLPTQKHA